MRLIDETWTADAENEIYVGEGPSRMTFLVPFPGQPDDMSARANLAAAAPAMARLLLDLEWSDSGSTVDGPCCPVCGADAPAPVPKSHLGPRGGVHEPDCALVATLRAAGVSIGT